MLKPIFAALGLCACAFVPAHAGNTPVHRDDDPAVITEWNTIAEGAISASAGVTLQRTYAMMHIAMFDAVNSMWRDRSRASGSSRSIRPAAFR
jgi:hypothetical protein